MNRNNRFFQKLRIQSVKVLVSFGMAILLGGCSGGGSESTTTEDSGSPLDLPVEIQNIPVGAKTVESFSYFFEDDFEREKDNSFWGGSDRGSAYVVFGASDTTNPANRVLAFNYTLQADGTSAWSQQDFHLPQVKEFALQYDLYIPENYQNSVGNSNHKLLVTWSGSYGTASEGLHISSEMWNSADGSGKVPSLNIGINDLGTSGDNRGHIIRSADAQEIAVAWGEGQWHRIYIYVQAAPTAHEFGAVEIWRDDIKLISTDDHADQLTGSWWLELGKDPASVIEYVQGANFIEYGYLLGWWNGAKITDTVTFQIDDFTVWAK